jgi:hypothetical protein
MAEPSGATSAPVPNRPCRRRVTGQFQAQGEPQRGEISHRLHRAELPALIEKATQAVLGD